MQLVWTKAPQEARWTATYEQYSLAIQNPGPLRPYFVWTIDEDDQRLACSTTRTLEDAQREVAETIESGLPT